MLIIRHTGKHFKISHRTSLSLMYDRRKDKGLPPSVSSVTQLLQACTAFGQEYCLILLYYNPNSLHKSQQCHGVSTSELILSFNL